MVPVAQRQSTALWLRGLRVRNPSGTQVITLETAHLLNERAV